MPVTAPARDDARPCPGPTTTATDGLPSLPAAVSAILQLACDVLISRGWTPYLQRPDDAASTPCTISQAIEAVTGTDRSGIPHQLRREALARLNSALDTGRPAHLGTTDVSIWEKVHGRTQNDVLDLLRTISAPPTTALPTCEGPHTHDEHRPVHDDPSRNHRVRTGSRERIQ